MKKRLFYINNNVPEKYRISGLQRAPQTGQKERSWHLRVRAFLKLIASLPLGTPPGPSWTPLGPLLDLFGSIFRVKWNMETLEVLTLEHRYLEPCNLELGTLEPSTWINLAPWNLEHRHLEPWHFATWNVGP